MVIFMVFVSPCVSKAIIQYKKASIGGSSVEGMRVCGQREKQGKNEIDVIIIFSLFSILSPYPDRQKPEVMAT